MSTSPQIGETIFRCPGEHYPISRSIHLARLAAFYPKCRECVHGEIEGGCLEETPSGKGAKPQAGAGMFRTNGVRGRYLNEVDRGMAAELAGAFASLLWDEDPPLVGGVTRSGPTVVIGFDERPASPDLVTGVALGLRRMGCQVVDIGLTTRACFWFAINHLHAAAGVLVSGSGCEPSFTGLDFVGRGSVPASNPGLLKALEERWTAGFSRTTRSPGSQRTFQAWVPYEAGLWKHFHALRPLRVVAGCASPTIRELLDRLFQPLACPLVQIPLPVRSADLADPRDSGVRRMRDAVVEEHADLGFVVGDDGQRTIVIDESGRMVSPLAWLDFLTHFVRTEQPAATVLRGCPTFAAASYGLQEGAAIAGDDAGYTWFDDPFPTSDAVVTIAKSLQALSRSDARVSEVIG